MRYWQLPLFLGLALSCKSRTPSVEITPDDAKVAEPAPSEPTEPSVDGETPDQIAEAMISSLNAEITASTNEGQAFDEGIRQYQLELENAEQQLATSEANLVSERVIASNAIKEQRDKQIADAELYLGVLPQDMVGFERERDAIVDYIDENPSANTIRVQSGLDLLAQLIIVLNGVRDNLIATIAESGLRDSQYRERLANPVVVPPFQFDANLVPEHYRFNCENEPLSGLHGFAGLSMDNLGVFCGGLKTLNDNGNVDLVGGINTDAANSFDLNCQEGYVTKPSHL